MSRPSVLIIILATMTSGELSTCKKFLSLESWLMTNSHPGTDRYSRGEYQATLMVPKVLSPSLANVTLEFSRQLTSLNGPDSMGITTTDNKNFLIQPADFGGSNFTFPFNAMFKGGSAESIRLKNVFVDGIAVCGENVL